jgi:penicillin-binding protein 2
MQAYFGITPPNPLPRTCQQDLPPLPPRAVPTPTAAPVMAGAAVRQEP